jgi:SAM-dependent methyltransferase
MAVFAQPALSGENYRVPVPCILAEDDVRRLAIAVPVQQEEFCNRPRGGGTRVMGDDAASVTPGQQALDVACGTGVLTRELDARVAPGGAVIGLDVNEGMLAVARRRTSSITWEQGEAEALPFDDDRIDAVTCQFGLMFFRDRKQAIREMLRVLRPGGRLAVAVWDKLENVPGYAAAAALLQRLFGADVAEGLRAPYCLGDVRVLTELFDDSSLSGLSVESRDGVVEFPSIRDWMYTDIKGWTLADTLDDDQYARLLKEASTTLAEFVGSDGKVEFASPIHIVSGGKA